MLRQQVLSTCIKQRCFKKCLFILKYHFSKELAHRSINKKMTQLKTLRKGKKDVRMKFSVTTKELKKVKNKLAE